MLSDISLIIFELLLLKFKGNYVGKAIKIEDFNYFINNIEKMKELFIRELQPYIIRWRIYYELDEHIVFKVKDMDNVSHYLEFYPAVINGRNRIVISYYTPQITNYHIN